MSFTSHIYGFAKDFQTLGAALIAFAAAALTFYSQKLVSERTSNTTLTAQRRQIAEQRAQDDIKNLDFRIAFSIVLSNNLIFIEGDVDRRKRQFEIFIRHTPLAESGLDYVVDLENVAWSAILGFKPIVPAYSVFSTTLSDVSRLDPVTQRQLHLLKVLCEQVDNAIYDVIHSRRPSGEILVSYPEAVRGFCQNASDRLESMSDVNNELYEKFSATLSEVKMRQGRS